MKKVLNVKMILVFFSLIILGISSTVFATGVLNTSDTQNNLNDNYNDAQTIPVDPNYILENNTVENETIENNTIDDEDNNISTGYNTNVNNTTGNETDLPQTGIQDYNVGILLIICVAASIYTYKKMKDYKNI